MSRVPGVFFTTTTMTDQDSMEGLVLVLYWRSTITSNAHTFKFAVTDDSQAVLGRRVALKDDTYTYKTHVLSEDHNAQCSQRWGMVGNQGLTDGYSGEHSCAAECVPGGDFFKFCFVLV